MTPPENAREQLKVMLKLVDDLKKSGNVEMLKVIDGWREKIIVALAETNQLDPFSVSVLKSRLERIHKEVEEQLSKVFSESQRRIFIKGVQTVDNILKAGNIIAGVSFLSEAKLQVLQKYTAEHVTDISQTARTRISREIDLAVLGQKPVGEVISAVGKNLKDPSVFGTITKRAETIYKTEVNRINNLATNDRINQFQNQVPDLQKKWLHSHVGIPRAGHLALHGTIIGAKEKFTLLGADGKTYLINAPHDPILPAGETVNCKCQIVPYVLRFRAAFDLFIREDFPRLFGVAA